MAKSHSTIGVPAERFNDATLKISAAGDLITTIAFLVEEAVGGDGELPVTGTVMSGAMYGIRLLLDAAQQDLLAKG